MTTSANLLYTAGADTSDFRSKLIEADSLARGKSASIVQAFDRVEQAAKGSGRGLRSITSNLRGLSSLAGTAGAQLGSLGGALTGAFAGGPVLAAITAAGFAISTVVTKYQETKKAAEELQKAQHEAWTAASTKIQEANDKLADQLRLKHLLQGVDSQSARNLLDAEDQLVSREWELDTLRERKARHDSLRTALVLPYMEPEERRRAAAERKILAKHIANFEEDEAELSAQVEELRRQVRRARAIAEREGANQPGSMYPPKAGSGEGDQGFGERGVYRLAGKAAVDFAKLERRSILETATLRAQLEGDAVRQIELRTQARVQALEAERDQEGATAEYKAAISAQIVAEEERGAAEIAKLGEEAERKKRAFALETRGILASLTESLVDDLEVQYDRDTAALKQSYDDQLISAEQYYERLEALRQQHLLRMAAAEAQAEALKAKARKDEEEAEKKAREAQTLLALNTGFAIGDNLSRGIREALEEGDATKAVIKTILGIGGILAGVLGGPIGGVIGGGAASMISGFFAEGGLIKGRSGGPRSDNLLIAASRGEYVNQASSVEKFGVDFFESLNAGVLDLTKLPRFADGGVVGAAPASSPAVAGGAAPIFYVPSFDPASTVEALGKVYGPASYRRGIARSDLKELAQTRRRVQAPRSGL